MNYEYVYNYKMLCHIKCTCSVLFASSVLNLCELVALRPDLAKSYKLYYFHENQLVYPVKKQQERDFQHGYSQILSWYVVVKLAPTKSSFPGQTRIAW